MRHISTLLNRELGAYFLGPMAYLVLLAFQVMAFLGTEPPVDTLSQPQRELSSRTDPMTTYIAGSPWFWIAMLVAVPHAHHEIDCRGRRSGTIETLSTCGHGDRSHRGQVVGGRGYVLRSARPVRSLSAVPLLSEGAIPDARSPARSWRWPWA